MPFDLFDAAQGRAARHCRRPHRVHPGVLDRPPAADAALLRLRRRGVRQDLRGADPARRDPRHPFDLFRAAVEVFIGMFTDPAARRFVIGVLLAFLPAAVIGALAHGFIKSVLFNPWVVCFTLIVGGAILLWVDQLDLKPRYHDATDVHAADVSRHRPVPVLRDDPRRVALRRDHRRRRCCSAPTSARPRSSRSCSRCRPWPAPSPTTSTRTAS